jgi:hypothetical protein
MSDRRLCGVVFVAVVASLVLAAGDATAQSVTVTLLQNNSSPNEVSNGTNNSYDRQSVLNLQSSGANTFQVRYASTLSCDSGAFGSSDTRTMSAAYAITFTVTSPAGYVIDVNTRRTGDANVQYDGGITGGSADMSAVTGSLTNASFVSGSLGLADPSGGSPDCNVGGGSTASCNLPVNQLGTARYTAISNGNPITHTLSFAWTQTTFTAAASGHEAAVRMGVQSRDSTNNASLYPGTPARTTMANDGHFITVTVTSLCGNGVIDPGEQCDEGANNGVGATCCTRSCTRKTAGTVCRLPVSACDPAETCSGTSGVCPPDAIASASVVCRAASAGQACDADEYCTGTSTVCPPDVVKPAGSVCRASAGACDLAEVCNGTQTTCPADAKSTGVCRPAAGSCDTAESCDGVNNACPPDLFLTSGVQCRPAAGVCDLAENCTGTSAACPSDAKKTSVCRASAGACDVAESCDGVNNTCPSDAFLPPTTVCRAAAGACDAAETCSGNSPLCPVDLFAPPSTVCRAAAGGCDVAESCSGTSTACPANQFAPASTVCRAAVDACDIAETCSGSAAACPSDVLAPATTVCRAATGTCDAAESCTGTSGFCPADVTQPNGTSCSNGIFCDGSETCQSGICTSGPPPCPGTCDESSATCPPTACGTIRPTCRSAAKSMLLIRNDTDDTKDRLIWKWLRGEPTTQAEFADPTASTEYALCVYAGIDQTLVDETRMPPTPGLWVPLGTSGFRYSDPSSSSYGIGKVILKGSTANKSKALVKGRGTSLPDPLQSGALPLPVVAQLVNTSNGLCWGGELTTVLRNSTRQFKGVIR